MELFDELVALFATDSSEALYRAEAELSHEMFLTFIFDVAMMGE